MESALCNFYKRPNVWLFLFVFLCFRATEWRSKRTSMSKCGECWENKNLLIVRSSSAFQFINQFYSLVRWCLVGERIAPIYCDIWYLSPYQSRYLSLELVVSLHILYFRPPSFLLSLLFALSANAKSFQSVSEFKIRSSKSMCGIISNYFNMHSSNSHTYSAVNTSLKCAIAALKAIYVFVSLLHTFTSNLSGIEPNVGFFWNSFPFTMQYFPHTQTNPDTRVSSAASCHPNEPTNTCFLFA